MLSRLEKGTQFLGAFLDAISAFFASEVIAIDERSLFAFLTAIGSKIGQSIA